MATEAQIAANRRNAQRSTGPRTAEGKARSSRNHLIHGLTATGLLDDESPDLLAAIHDDFRRDFQPQTSVEEVLIERMAMAYFRLGRFSPIEADLLQREEAEPTHEQLREEYGDDERPYGWSARQYGRVTKSYVCNQKTLHRLSLYEARLQRDFDRALRDLQRLQRDRRDTPALVPPPPEAIPEPPQPQVVPSPPAEQKPLPKRPSVRTPAAAALLATAAFWHILHRALASAHFSSTIPHRFASNRPFLSSGRLMMRS